jgi:hypothetical protein
MKMVRAHTVYHVLIFALCNGIAYLGAATWFTFNPNRRNSREIVVGITLAPA